MFINDFFVFEALFPVSIRYAGLGGLIVNVLGRHRLEIDLVFDNLKSYMVITGRRKRLSEYGFN